METKWIITLLMSIVIVFYIVAGILPSAQDAGDDLGQDSAGSCVAVGCVWNTTGGQCINMTSIVGDHSDTGDCAVTLPTMPLSGLFASGGIVFILIAIALLLWVIAIAKSKK